MKKILMIMLVLVLGLSLVGCNNSADDKDVNDEVANKDNEKTIDILYGEWDSTIASTNVLKAVFEEKLGYDVELTSVSMVAIWEGIASGDGDGMICAWLPTMHGDFYEEYKDKVDNLGVNLSGTKMGLVVPEYVDIDTVEELKTNIDLFDGKIIGIDPGAGLMMKAQKAMEEYDLEDFELIEGSGATMVAVLADAIKNEEPVVVTTWTPHWMFGNWDLKYLDDPKEIFGGEQEIYTMTRQGLKEDDPVAYEFLDKFNWTAADMEEVMNMNRVEGSDLYENAKKWVAENEDKVNAWLE